MTVEGEFTDFPREELSFAISRRDLFASLRSEIDRHGESGPSGPRYSLRRLGALPDDALAEVVPVVVPSARFTSIDGSVWGHAPSETSRRHLFEDTAVNRFLLDAMRGQGSLRDIADWLTVDFDWPPEQAFAHVRGLFLHLVVARVVTPASSPP